MRKNLLLSLNLVLAFLCAAAVPAIDFSKAADRDRQPRFEQISHKVGMAEGLFADGPWAYRFQITKAWTGELPRWPSVDLYPSVHDFTGYDRIVVDAFNDSIGGDTLCIFIAGPDGRIQNGLSRSQPLDDRGFHRWTIPLDKWPKTTDPKNIGRIHFFFTTPCAADVYLSGFHLLRPGEEPPPVNEEFRRTKLGPAQAEVEAQRRARREESLRDFIARCRAVGQSGGPAWIGRATSMQKVRPRTGETIAAADSFTLKLARGEYESLQVLVVSTDRELKDVTVEPLDLKRESDGWRDWFRAADELPRSAFKCSPVGYVKTLRPPPYMVGANVSTNLPGGYYRRALPTTADWWPDPILDWNDSADVKPGDLQSFWLRLKCPDDQRAGRYRGTLRVKGEGWCRDFPFTVRVYGFTVPRTSPLPLAITFSPGPSTQFAGKEQLALAKKLRADPLAPINQWKQHRTEWGDFLADYYMVMDNLYHDGSRVQWEVLQRLKDQGRLGWFNLGYWDYPRQLDEAAKKEWIAGMHRHFDAPYNKAKELGLLDHAYLYGCDEVSSNYFPNIEFALAELKKAYPGVPLSTTAYDKRFGMEGSVLGKMDWFTPNTEYYAKSQAAMPAARAAGHQVWWYIACGPRAPYANMFVECPAIEGRQLMGAQTVKFRPEGFLYYQTTIWNSERPISGRETFTDWNPKSWTSYHGDGSWFCCGPEGKPCATIRMENFRDGLEDYAYALEYERVTGRRAEVPPEVCREIDQFSDDPEVYYRWRDALAEAIEKP